MKNILMCASIAALGALALPSAAHDGHDDAPAAVTASGPRRLPDGGVILPKASQRQLAIRTVVAERKRLPRSLELAGKVILDPNAGGMVQSTQAGRVEPGPKGLPSLGRTVRKGDVLAYIRPSNGALERGGQAALAAELRAGKALAEKRVARLEQLDGSVPGKDIEAARHELQSLSGRLAAVAASLSAPEALVAPASGVIASAAAVAGQVVEPRELLFEIVDPGRLRVEALVYDLDAGTDIAGAVASPAAGVALPLDLIGTGRALREQAIPVQFRVRPDGAGAPPLALGQPVRVLAQTRTMLAGIPVAAAAIVKNAANQDIVWVHTEAEHFVPKSVRVAPLDGARVALLDGVEPGERIVVRGASLLNQVR